MKQEDIKRIKHCIANAFLYNQVSTDDMLFMMQRYIKERTQKDIEINYNYMDIALLDAMFRFPLDYFKAKFGCIMLRDQSNRVLSVKFEH